MDPFIRSYFRMEGEGGLVFVADGYDISIRSCQDLRFRRGETT